MKQFTYTINEEKGLSSHAAGLLAKQAKQFAALCSIANEDGASKKFSQIMGVMSMRVKRGDVVTVTADGEDEEEAIVSLKKLFYKHL